jgi:UDP-N-acetylglucosamine 2-epimerase (non-hydrolysing)
MRVLSIFGTRPEAVKMAPVIKALQTVKGVESIVCVTAQHRQMLDQVLHLFDICPEVDLDLMRPDQTLAELTASIFIHLDPVLTKMKPDWILVQGDTTTVMTAAILGFYHRVKIGHVEAGLRTGDKWQPFPEEINRKIAGVVADLHFAPTEHSRRNLILEGIPAHRILVTGNPGIDALNMIVGMQTPPQVEELLTRLEIKPDGKQLVLVTAHRRENFGKPLEGICRALRILAETYPHRLQLVFPVHMNPNVQEPVYRILQGVPNITLLPPMDYLPLVHLMKHAILVLTDSGGIQEEATSLHIPALVMRHMTERPEGMEAGVLRLVGTDCQVIFEQAQKILDNLDEHQLMTVVPNPFGDGHAAERIVQALLDYKE